MQFTGYLVVFLPFPEKMQVGQAAVTHMQLNQESKTEVKWKLCGPHHSCFWNSVEGEISAGIKSKVSWRKWIMTCMLRNGVEFWEGQ